MEYEIHFVCKGCMFKERREIMFMRQCHKVENFASLTDQENISIVFTDFETQLID